MTEYILKLLVVSAATNLLYILITYTAYYSHVTLPKYLKNQYISVHTSLQLWPLKMVDVYFNF